MLKVVLIIILVGCWIVLDYYQLKLFYRKKVRRLTGKPFSLGIVFSLVRLYFRRNHYLFFLGKNVEEFKNWITSLESEIQKDQALVIARNLLVDVKGEPDFLAIRSFIEDPWLSIKKYFETQTDLSKLIADANNGIKSAHDVARILMFIILHQINLGHSLLNGLVAGLLPSAIPVVVIGYFLFSFLN